ncbi:MAG TPA: Rpn family recombination-promoting nuclease/putative transposase [Planctomycetota bacterium]|nr:Rpn family recombination-promoting nuclease/putative transposase [Planctomycetota bacterium]
MHHGTRIRTRRRPPPSPHDALFRGIFGAPARAAELLRHLMPARCALRIDWSSLRAVDRSFVDERLRTQQADLIFSARLKGSGTLIYLLLEHKSGPYRLTVFQVAGYVMRIWERWLADHPKSRFLPAVMPFVLFHGRHTWCGPRQLHRLIDLPRSLRFCSALPSFSFELEVLNARRVRRLVRRRLPLPSLLPLLHLQAVRGCRDMATLLRSWTGYYRRLMAMPGGESIVRRLVSYVFAVSRDDPRRLQAAYTSIHPTTEAYYMTELTTGERLFRKGVRKGVRKGQRALLKALLEERFGPLPATVLARLAAATGTDLDRWARRILRAKTLVATLS